MQAAGDYSEAYFLHGLSVQMAEAMADYVNARICDELRLDRGGGGGAIAGATRRFQSWPTTSASSGCWACRRPSTSRSPNRISSCPSNRPPRLLCRIPGSVYFAVREAASANAG